MSFGQSRRHGCSSDWLKSVMGNHLRPRNIVYCSSVSRHVGVFCRVYLGNNEIPMMNIGDSDRSCQSCMVMYRIGWIIICIQLIFIYIYIHVFHYFIYDFLIFCNPWFIIIFFRPIGWSTILIVQSFSRSWNAGRLQQQCRPQIRWMVYVPGFQIVYPLRN